MFLLSYLKSQGETSLAGAKNIFYMSETQLSFIVLGSGKEFKHKLSQQICLSKI